MLLVKLHCLCRVEDDVTAGVRRWARLEGGPFDHPLPNVGGYICQFSRRAGIVLLDALPGYLLLSSHPFLLRRSCAC